MTETQRAVLAQISARFLEGELEFFGWKIESYIINAGINQPDSIKLVRPTLNALYLLGAIEPVQVATKVKPGAVRIIGFGTWKILPACVRLAVESQKPVSPDEKPRSAQKRGPSPDANIAQRRKIVRKLTEQRKSVKEIVTSLKAKGIACTEHTVKKDRAIMRELKDTN